MHRHTDEEIKLEAAKTAFSIVQVRADQQKGHEFRMFSQVGKSYASRR